MIAYVFWHLAADPDGYEERLAEFHATLAADPPDGFVESVALRTRVPWMGADTAYEDWYLVDSWGALGVLNDAAVDRRRRPSHDVVATAARHGAGGVYMLRSGEVSLTPAAEAAAAWWDKPSSDSYAQALAALSACGGSLWQRQLVLGPAPEFCLIGPAQPPEGALVPARAAVVG